MTPEADRAVARIHECLNEVYLPEGVQVWLSHRNRNLDMHTPQSLISSGRLSSISAVLAEAERLSGGAW